MRENMRKYHDRLVKGFQHFKYQYDFAIVFNDFLDFVLLLMRWDKENRDFTYWEDKYGKDYDRKVWMQLYRDLVAISENNGQGFYDGLGDVYMELSGEKKLGINFSPPDMCSLVVALGSIGKKPKPKETFGDPTCGSGRILLAAAKVEREMIFYGSDISPTCCKMAVINMLFNTMIGEIAHMDILLVKHYHSWHLKRAFDGKHYIPYYYETASGITNIVHKGRAKSQVPTSIDV